MLRQVAALLRSAKRPNDLLGRLGGEEFGLLMPETGSEEALIAAERFREAVAQARLEIAPGKDLKVTASFGIAAIGTHIPDAESWFAAADAPLYAAKRGGRNRCEVA